MAIAETAVESADQIRHAVSRPDVGHQMDWNWALQTLLGRRRHVAGCELDVQDLRAPTGWEPGKEPAVEMGHQP